MMNFMAFCPRRLYYVMNFMAICPRRLYYVMNFMATRTKKNGKYLGNPRIFLGKYVPCFLGFLG